VIKRRAGGAESGTGSFRGALGPFDEAETESVRPTQSFLLALLAGALVGAAGLFAFGCHGAHPLTPAERGAVIYRSNCSACHNENPNLPGSLGPAIAGSPKELIEARVLHGAYPVGYDPKRRTHIMRPLPWLGPHIDDLTAYLAAAKTD